jgi:hypothetical protein
MKTPKPKRRNKLPMTDEELGQLGRRVEAVITDDGLVQRSLRVTMTDKLVLIANVSGSGQDTSLVRVARERLPALIEALEYLRMGRMGRAAVEAAPLEGHEKWEV